MRERLFIALIGVPVVLGAIMFPVLVLPFTLIAITTGDWPSGLVVLGTVFCVLWLVIGLDELTRPRHGAK